MNPELEKLVQMSLVDGQVTDKEREIILRKAIKLGLDVDEVEMYLEGFISSNKSNTISGKNHEIRTSENDVKPTRKFTPKTVNRIEPALLNKESKLKLNIEELNSSKTLLFDELENLYKNIKTPQDYLESQKIIVDNQLITIKAEFDKTSETYLDKFINEINLSVSEKFGNTALIYNNREKLIDLDSNKIVTLIKKYGEWDISTLNNKYNKRKLFSKVFMWVSIIVVMINGLIQRENHEDAGWGTGIWFFSFVISMIISSYYSELIKNNKMNFNVEDLNPILNRIVLKFKNEFEELVTIKNNISELERLQSKLKLKNITEFKRK